MTLFEPFAPLFELSQELDRRMASGVTTSSFAPPADVMVADDEVTVIMDVPGVKGDELTIELQDDVLTVRGERPVPARVEDDRRVWQRLERGFGTFERVLRIPSDLDPEKITASMADGVLTLRIPKPDSRKPRRIAIQTGSQPETIEGTASEQRELAGKA